MSSYSYLNISGTNSNLNTLSSYSYLNISGVSNNISVLSLSTSTLNSKYNSLSIGVNNLSSQYFFFN